MARGAMTAALAAVVVGLLSGCGGGGGSSPPPVTAQDGPFLVSATTGTVPTDFSGYETALDAPPVVTPRTSYSAGDEVVVQFVLKNTSAQPQTITLGAGTFVVKAQTAGGTLVYDSTPDYVDPGPAVTVQPGQYFVERPGWNQKNKANTAVAAGTYVISGSFQGGFRGPDPAPTTISIQ
jgi:hypothetical protein